MPVAPEGSAPARPELAACPGIGVVRAHFVLRFIVPHRARPLPALRQRPINGDARSFQEAQQVFPEMCCHRVRQEGSDTACKQRLATTP